jgi:hypothetical protein
MEARPATPGAGKLPTPSRPVSSPSTTIQLLIVFATIFRILTHWLPIILGRCLPSPVRVINWLELKAPSLVPYSFTSA